MSPTSQLKDREKQSNKSRSNSPSVKFNTQDIIVPPPPVHYQQHHQPVQPSVPPIPPTVPVLPQQKIPFEQPSHYPPHLPRPYSNTAKSTHDQQNMNYDFGKPPLNEPPPGFTNMAANFSPQLGCQLFPQGVGDRGFFGQAKDSDDYPRDLRALLEQLGLTKYMNVFEEQDVDLQVFLSLTDQDLKEIGIKLFGPRKKMTNAIARWQSKAPLPASNKIEQAYADRLEGEMQEMALQLHKSAEQVETLKAEVLQEKQIRIVTETCLNEERGAWHHMQRVILEMRQKCDEMRESLRNLKHYHSEIKLKFQNPDLGGAMKDDLPLDEKTWQSANERAASADILLKKVEQQIKEIQKNLSVVAMHGDRILGRSANTPEASFT
ncbi:hypothetical protein FSP39_009784 [Pinctada imbricata]|uniref:SAM domain-containing protein n=1 Tax=Pinctada imbricata TaxID=66713 RepID=A0AA89CD93_PINIB|nr:hypothetical protein FSP39_009784 [Pinctada imbricata]